METDLILANNAVCKENLEYFAQHFPTPEDRAEGGVAQVLHFISQNNPVSVCGSVLETSIKAFALARRSKYYAASIQSLSELEQKRINALVESKRIDCQTQVLTLSICKSFQREIEIVKKEKLISLAVIDANLKLELEKMRIADRKATRAVLNANAIFSQAVKQLNADMALKTQMVLQFTEALVRAAEQFRVTGRGSWNISREKELADYFFSLILKLTDNHTSYINVEQFGQFIMDMR